jgi:ABC-2 type transport system ATP-binding protein
MEETAEHVIVIGRGKLIADASMADFMLQSAGSHVRVITPQATDLVPLLERTDASVTRSDDGALLVTGLDAPAIGDIAADNSIRIHELSPRRASLEAVFMELTSESVDYRSTGQPEENTDVLAEQESR